MTNGKTLILGANGFLGRAVSRQLAMTGHQLRLFDLTFSRQVIGLTSEDVEFFEGSMMNPSDVARALEGVSAVLHFVSTTMPASSENDLSIEIDTNVAMSAKLLELMAEAGVGFIGFSSSGGTVYAPGPGPHSENDEISPSCNHGHGKAMIESLIQQFSRDKSIDYQIWRISNAYGNAHKHTDNQGAIDVFLRRIKNGQSISLWDDGSAERDFVHVNDVAQAIQSLLNNGIKNETVNIGSGRATSLNRVIEIIESVVGQPFEVNRTNGYTGVAKSVLDCTKIARLIDWKADISLEEGITETWQRLNNL